MIRGDTITCGSPFFSGSFPSRQWHDWQSYEGPVSRCLVTAPPTTPAPPGNRIRRSVSRPSTFLASPVGEAEEAGESRSMLLANSEVDSAFLRACNYMALVPQRPSSATMADLHAKCFRSCLCNLWHVFHSNITASRKARGGSLPRPPVLLRPSCGSGSQACELWSSDSRGAPPKSDL